MTSDNALFYHHFYSNRQLLFHPSPLLMSHVAGSGFPLQFAELKPRMKIVDFGCGSGLDVILAAMGLQGEGGVVGIDVSPERIDQALAAVEEAGLAGHHILFRVADVQGGTSLPRNFADLLLTNGLLYQCPNYLAVYRNMFRALKPGGNLIISDYVCHEELRIPKNNLNFLSHRKHLQILDQLSFTGIETLHDTTVPPEILESVFSGSRSDRNFQTGSEIFPYDNEHFRAITIKASRPPFSC